MSNTLNDRLNLLDLASYITGEIRSSNSNTMLQPRNVKTFLLISFDGILKETDREYASIRDFQKLLSGEDTRKNIFSFQKDLESGIFDSILLNNMKKIVDTLYLIPQKTSQSDDFPDKIFLELQTRIERRFFNATEYEDLQSSIARKDFEQALFIMVKHSMRCLDQIPDIFYKKVYLSTKALAQSRCKEELLRISAENGCGPAIADYTEILDGKITAESAETKKHELALKSFLLRMQVLDQPDILWSCLYSVERGLVAGEQIKALQSKLRIEEKITTLLERNPGLKAKFELVNTESDVDYFLYSAMFYLGYGEQYNKAFNSLAKYIEHSCAYRYDDSLKHQPSIWNFQKSPILPSYTSIEQLSLDYYKEAARAGDVFAMTNLGSILLKGDIALDEHDRISFREMTEKASTFYVERALENWEGIKQLDV